MLQRGRLWTLAKFTSDHSSPTHLAHIQVFERTSLLLRGYSPMHLRTGGDLRFWPLANHQERARLEDFGFLPRILGGEVGDQPHSRHLPGSLHHYPTLLMEMPD